MWRDLYGRRVWELKCSGWEDVGDEVLASFVAIVVVVVGGQVNCCWAAIHPTGCDQETKKVLIRQNNNNRTHLLFAICAADARTLVTASGLSVYSNLPFFPISIPTGGSRFAMVTLVRLLRRSGCGEGIEYTQ